MNIPKNYQNKRAKIVAELDRKSKTIREKTQHALVNLDSSMLTFMEFSKVSNKPIEIFKDMEKTFFDTSNSIHEYFEQANNSLSEIKNPDLKSMIAQMQIGTLNNSILSLDTQLAIIDFQSNYLKLLTEHILIELDCILKADNVKMLKEIAFESLDLITGTVLGLPYSVITKLKGLKNLREKIGQTADDYMLFTEAFLESTTKWCLLTETFRLYLLEYPENNEDIFERAVANVGERNKKVINDWVNNNDS